jgi:hypothetical protein
MSYEEAKGAFDLDEFACLTRAYKVLTREMPQEEEEVGDEGAETQDSFPPSSSTLCCTLFQISD